MGRIIFTGAMKRSLRHEELARWDWFMLVVCTALTVGIFDLINLRTQLGFSPEHM